MHEEVARIATDGVGADELRRVQARTEAQLLRQADSVLGRTLGFAAAEIIHGRAELAGELAARLAAVTPDQVQAAARDLDPDTAAVLELRADRRSAMTAALDLSLVPPLGEPRPQPVPVGAGDDAAQRPARRRRAPAGRPADRAAPAGALRRGGRARPPARTPRAASVLSGAVLLGTAAHDQTGIAELLQSHGAELSVSADPDRLLFATTLLTSGLEPVLEPARRAAHRRHLPRRRRSRASGTGVAERIAIARSQPGVIARTALAARRYGEHPYAIQLPDAELVAAVDGDRAPRRCTASGSLPAGSTLVLVGDLDPQAATDAVGDGAGRLVGERARGRGAAGRTSCTPAGIELVDRPGRRPVQRPARRPGAGPHRPDLAAVRLANMIFGGYFSSRLVENIRERRGYTYSPRSSVDHQAGRLLVPRRGRRRHRGDRPGAAGDLVRAGPHGARAGHRGRAGRRPPLRPRQHGAGHRDPRGPGQHAVGAGRRRPAGRLARRAPAGRWPP